MALRRTWTLAALTVALCALAPVATAETPLPDARTHVDPAGAPDPEAPELTYFKSDTDANDVRRGYIYVRARCDVRCVVEVTARSRIRGRTRVIAFTRKELPTNRIRRVRLRIRSDVRRRIAAGARWTVEAVPFPPSDV